MDRQNDENLQILNVTADSWFRVIKTLSSVKNIKMHENMKEEESKIDYCQKQNGK